MASPAPLACPHCQAPIRPGDAEPGARMICPACGREVVVPTPAALGESALAGSADDRAVTLVPSQDASTLTAARRPAADGDAATEAWQRLADAPGAGRYVESGPIARGGMGEIVLCIDRNIRRPVAMKRILDEVADDPSRRARFVEEAQVTGQLEHPNIVPVHELDRAPDGTLYFTMKLVKGRSLADILASLRPLPPGEGARPPTRGRAGEGPASEGSPSRVDTRVGAGPRARPTREQGQPSLAALLQIFLKVCDGVAFAHSRGVVHRDLKPANIMVGGFGEVLVMDWGLAKIVGREDIRAADLVTSDRADTTPELTLDGSAIGTPAYMPPEQANGELDQIDHRSDIYSLGAILYELLTLEKPVEGETPLVVLANAAHGHIVPPEQRTPARAIPRELSAIAMKCLNKLRSRRYQSVPELQRDITLHLEGRSVSAAPDTFAQAAVKLVKRNKGISASIAAAAVVVIALTTGFMVGLRRERDQARANELRAVRGEGEALAAKERQRASALAASRMLAEQAVRAADEARFTEAGERAKTALAVLPDGPWGYYALGFVAAAEKDFAAARKHFEEALRHDPAHAPSKLSLAGALAASGEVERAEALLEATKTTSDWRSLAAAGDTLFAAERLDASLRAYRRARDLLARDAAAPKPAREALHSKLRRSEACLAMRGFYDSIRELDVEEQARRLEAKLKEVYQTPRVSVTTRGDTLGTVRLGGGSRVPWLDPLRGIPFTGVDVSATTVDDLTPLKGMLLTELSMGGTRVTDLAPLRGMPLTILHFPGQGIQDLTALKGMPLTHLVCPGNPIRTLAPLKGMPLRVLVVVTAPVVDLSPLAGMPLEELVIHATAVSDLRPLGGAPLRHLGLNSTRVHDLSPLAGMPLRTLEITRTQVRDLTPLAGMRLIEFVPPDRKQLTPASLEVIETLKKQGCNLMGWK